MVFDPVGWSLEILKEKFSGGTIVGLPYHIEIIDDFRSERDESFRHKLNYTFYYHYRKKKPIKTGNDTARTETPDDMPNEFADQILERIQTEFGGYSFYNNFIFEKKQITRGYRIVVARRDGS
ncbi:hypothetical protein J4427_02125 [Candidatus Woesearchaeota archaeon]|nr:hypothetical protein [Candidatus Woesearchaeota archaeon]